MNFTNGATLTGGSTVTLSPSGVSPGKSTFVGPSSTRLAPKIVEFTSSVSGTTPTNPGVARSGMKISFADRSTEEGCCTVNAGGVTINIGTSWSLNQPSTMVDDAISYLRGLVYTDAFKDALVKGILPSA